MFTKGKSLVRFPRQSPKAQKEGAALLCPKFLESGGGASEFQPTTDANTQELSVTGPSPDTA